MVCYHPIKAWRSKEKSPNGKYFAVFNKADGYADMPMTLACGNCVGCRIARSASWATRCQHEASLYDRNCFITLTYNEENVPRGLVKADFQKFMKRLRKAFPHQKIRFFHCGEYGSTLQRPHFHAILFNFDFDDREHWSRRDGVYLDRSRTLEKLWPFGFSTIGDVTFESCAYVARYIMKKVTGEKAEGHYWSIDDETGECYAIEPEYITMSRRPGIAKEWIEKYHNDIYTDDQVVLQNGKKLKPPRYYDSIYDNINPNSLQDIKTKRKIKAVSSPDNTYERLRTREAIQLRKIKKLERGYENEKENIHNL